jgi:hypothetical protein
MFLVLFVERIIHFILIFFDFHVEVLSGLLGLDSIDL